MEALFDYIMRSYNETISRGLDTGANADPKVVNTEQMNRNPANKEKCNDAALLVETNLKLKEHAISLIKMEHAFKMDSLKREVWHQLVRHNLEVEILTLDKKKRQLELETLQIENEKKKAELDDLKKTLLSRKRDEDGNVTRQH